MKIPRISRWPAARCGTDHHRHLEAAGEGGGLHGKDEHLLQGDAHLPDAGGETERAYLSRRQLQDHRGLAGKPDQRRADHAVD